MIVQVYAASRRPDHCRSCGRKIEWVIVVKSGKSMPFDSPVSILNESEDFEGRRFQTIDTEKSKSHFATCPDAANWRGRRRGASGR